MGQKVNPNAMRLGINKNPDSSWYAEPKDYVEYIFRDNKLRTYLMDRFESAGVCRILIERPAQNARIRIICARPGVIIGKRGSDVEKLKQEASRIIGFPTHVTVEEVKKPELEASLVASNIAAQLVKRVAYRKAIKRAIQTSMRAGAVGVKICVSGRLGGAEIARHEWSKEGRIPLQTFRADINYATAIAKTTYGIIGVKVWIYRGDVFEKE